MHLFEEPNTFCSVFLSVLKCTENCEHFEEKDEPYSLSISQIIDSKRGGYLNV